MSSDSFAHAMKMAPRGSPPDREARDVTQPGADRQLVMAIATGYSPDEVRPFVRSLRNSGYPGAIVLFVDRNLRQGLHREAIASDLTLIQVPRWRPQIVGQMIQTRRSRVAWGAVRTLLWSAMRLLSHLPVSGERRDRLQSPVADRLYTPTESRFFRYRRFLRAGAHERILLSDVRDVLFQRNPFLDLPPAGLGVSIEAPAYTLATEPHNARWLRLAYGDSVLEQVGENPVSCAGVTCGDRTTMAKYLDLMVREIERLSPSQVAIPGGIEQAMHNFLIWSRQIENIHPLETMTSTVTTLHGFQEAEVPISPRGTVLNRDGSEPSIVHQYDRVPGLAARLSHLSKAGA